MARTTLSCKVPVCYAVQNGGAANQTFFQQRVVIQLRKSALKFFLQVEHII
jgi:hypothetical protein